MTNKILKLAIFSVLTLCMVACGQAKSNLSEIEMEDEIDAICNKILDNQIDFDDWSSKIIQIFEANPQSLDYPFDSWSNEYRNENWITNNPFIAHATSNDGNVRVYNFEENGFGGNPSYGFSCRHFVQYRVADKVFQTDFPPYSQSYISNVYSVETENQTYYLFVESGGVIAQGEHNFQIVTAYEIDAQGNFQRKKLFKTKQGLIDEIEISWDDDGGNDGDDDKLYNRKISYNENVKILYIPLITDVMTEKNLLYQWKNNQFEYVGTKNILHSSIENYKQKKNVFETEKFLVRIDQMNNGKYRYASWSKNKTMTDIPDLIIENGIKECWSEEGGCDCGITYDNGESAVLGERYVFKSREYEYVYETGWWKGRTIYELAVKKNGEEILREEIK